MKCLINERYGPKDRSILRKIVFNIERCMFNEFIGWLLFGGSYAPDEIAYRMTCVAFYTLIIDRVLPKKLLEQYALWFVFLINWYGFTFGYMWIDANNYLETWFDGHIVKMLFWSFYLMAMYLQGDIVEDFFFGDMGTKIGIWSNWGLFGPYFI